MDKLYAPVMAMSTVPQVQFMLIWVATTIIAFFTNLALSQVTNIPLRKTIVITSGLTLGLYYNGMAQLFTYLSFMLVWVSMKLTPRKLGYHLAMGVAVGSLLLHNIYAWVANIQVQSFVHQEQFNFIKVHIFLCNYKDAGSLDDPKKAMLLSEREKRHAEHARKLPSFVDWMAFMTLASTAFCGMAFEFHVFLDWLYLRGDVAKMPANGNVVPAFKRMAQVAGCVGVALALNSICDPMYMTREAFASESLPYRVVYSMISMSIKKYQLYAGFAASEAIFMASGLGYRAKTERTAETYNAIRCVKIWSAQF